MEAWPYSLTGMSSGSCRTDHNGCAEAGKEITTRSEGRESLHIRTHAREPTLRHEIDFILVDFEDLKASSELRH